MYFRQIFFIQMKYRLQILYNHMVGRAASVVSPLCSLLPGLGTNNIERLKDVSVGANINLLVFKVHSIIDIKGSVREK